jgi:hypothetical protein
MREPRVWSRRCAKRLGLQLRLQWTGPPDTQVRRGQELVIALQVLPLARRCLAGAGVSLIACFVQLAAQQQGLLAASLLAAFGAAAVMARRDLWLSGQAAAVRLRLTGEGQILVYCRDGRVDPVRLRPQSLRVGGGVLLVLRGTRTYRLWLSNGNVEPGALAALHRRLGRGSAGLPGLR